MPKKDESIKKVLEEIEDKAIESRYTNMYDWQRRELSKEDLFEYAEEMREELRTIGSKGRHVFTATFVRFGFRNGYIGPVKTMLLQDVTLDSKIVSDHLWFDLTKGFSSADLSPGDVVEFCARVSAYEKGYKGHKDDVLNRPIERDYRLSRPTKIKKIGKKLILKDEGGE